VDAPAPNMLKVRMPATIIFLLVENIISNLLYC
jgi:hypothetical protein